MVGLRGDSKNRGSNPRQHVEIMLVGTRHKQTKDEITNSWGSHSRLSHSVFKSVPKMERDHKVQLIFKDGEEITVHKGYDSGSRSLIKKMHKKKRRQLFKKTLLEE